MRAALIPGLQREATLEITTDLTVPRVSSRLATFAGMPPVFATAFLVAFVEATCSACVKEHLDDDERTVGTHVDISHTAATPVGLTVTARVELTRVAGRSLTFRVEAADDAGPIGGGTHRRAVIHLARFMDNAAAKRTAIVAPTPPVGPER